MSSPRPTVLPHLSRLPGYAPVVPLAERARQAGLAPADCLKLDANENPHGMHPAVREALRTALHDPHFGAIYPDPNQVELRGALSRYTGLDPAMIIPGAGADELLDLVFRALLPPGGAIINCPPAFGMYPFLADVNQLAIINAPRGEDFQLRGESLLQAVRAAGEHSLVALTSPNNPSGDLASAELLEALLAEGATIMLDEAYIEFAGLNASAAGLIAQYPRLIIMRTLSKWAGIAGLRLGYALADAGLVAELSKIRQPYSVNHAAEVAGLAALKHADQIGAQIAEIRGTRDALFQALQQIDGLEPLPSRANFILIRVDPSIGSGRQLHDRLAALGVFTRVYSDPLLASWLRISMPRRDQLGTLIERIGAAL